MGFSKVCNGDGGKTRDRLAPIQPLSQKNQKDIIDSEQLVYLGDDSLCMPPLGDVGLIELASNAGESKVSSFEKVLSGIFSGDV
jgi:hypothetical protein